MAKFLTDLYAFSDVDRLFSIHVTPTKDVFDAVFYCDLMQFLRQIYDLYMMNPDTDT